MQYGINKVGGGIKIFEPVTLGFPSLERIEQKGYPGTVIGKNAILRSGTTIYCDVVIGNNFSTGHNVLIREYTYIGDNMMIGSSSIIEGHCVLGNNVRIQSMVFIPTHTKIGNGVFIAPCVVFTNDRYPPFGDPVLEGAVIEDNVTIGANATILPSVTLRKGCAVAAGAVVTKDVPEGVLALGVPARFKPMPKEMVHTIGAI